MSGDSGRGECRGFEFAGSLVHACASRCGVVPLCAGAAWLLVSGTEVRAQAVTVEVRAGIVASTPLVRDRVVDAAFLDRGPGETLGAPAEVTLRADPAPVLVLAARAGLSPVVAVELAGGWTWAALVGRQAGEEWAVEDVGIGHVAVAVRHAVADGYHVRGGVGAIRYGATGGVFAGGDVRPMLEAGGGGEWRMGAARLTLALLGQAHPFGTAGLRTGGGSGARGLDGTVYRVALQAGVSIGRVRP